MAVQNFRYIGVTDECVQCQCCGKDNLKSTVVLALLDTDGNDEEITYYGSTCAARALGVRGGGRAVRERAQVARRKTIQRAEDARQVLDRYEISSTGEIYHPRGRSNVVLNYMLAHKNAMWFTQKIDADWDAMVDDMIARQVAAINEAKLLGIEIACRR